MTEELTTRGPFDSDPGVLVRWMLKSGQRVNRPIGNVDVQRTRDGIQLYVPTRDRVVELDLADVHEAGDLYVALEAHMENVAMVHHHPDGTTTRGPETARSMTTEEREAMTPNTPKVIQPDAGVDEEFLEAMEDVMAVWTNNGSHANVRHEVRRARVEESFPGLAAALDRLAGLNA